MKRRRTSYIGRFSGLIEGKSVISSVVEKSKGILKIIRSLRVGRDDNLVYFERSRRMSHIRLPQTTHGPPSSLLRVAQRFVLERSEEERPILAALAL